MNKYSIMLMQRDEVDLVFDWAIKEGWNPGLYDAECFFNAAPSGFYCGKLNDDIITVACAPAYDKHFAFFGLYIVHPAYRGLGYGLALSKVIFADLSSYNVGLDGVTAMTDHYARFGFKFAHLNSRYTVCSKSIVLAKDPAIVALSQCPWQTLVEYDRQHFPAYRENFLRQWITQAESLALGWYEQGQLYGYGVIRKCREDYKIGPLFANSLSISVSLFSHLSSHAQGNQVYLDVPEINPNAQKLAQYFNMHKVFETSRMYTQKKPQLKMGQIYGITSFEFG